MSEPAFAHSRQASRMARPAGLGLREPKAKQTQEPGERGHSNGTLEWRARQDSNLRPPA